MDDLVAGASSGVLAGLFGVGGGTVMVPVLYEVFSLYGVPDDVLMPLCVGTSLAVIVPTSISSFIGHYRKGAVDIGVLKVWALPITKLHRPVRASSHSAAFFRSLSASWAKRIASAGTPRAASSERISL